MGKDKQFTLEIQEILAFRSRIAQLFRDFDAKFSPFSQFHSSFFLFQNFRAIPEMTASFVPRTPSDDDKLKVFNQKFKKITFFQSKIPENNIFFFILAFTFLSWFSYL